MAPDNSPEANRYRIERLERDVHDIQRKLDDYGELRQQVRTIAHDCDRLDDDFGALRRAIITAALTVGGSAIIFGVSIVVAVLQ